MNTKELAEQFSTWRYGMFVHYGLFSALERGEWVMNRERIPPSKMREIAAKFSPDRFDAEALCDLAVRGGMRYVTFTTMHHDGFRLYETELSDFNSMRVCGRDLVEEVVTAARERGLKVALYHSLNNWFDQPDACDALESPDAYEEFVGKTFARIRELVTRFNPVDVLWYDGWWPFDAEGWRGEAMNAMVREIQPNILFNGRNGLAGDFGTPEGHMSAPSPWRPWETCMTLNDHWGYHRGDRNWKTPEVVIGLLAGAAQEQGNLLLNIGPRGDGSVPESSVEIVETVGEWLQVNGEAVRDTDAFTFGLMDRADHNGDWSHNGSFTLRGKSLYHIVRYWPGAELVVAGLQATVERVTLLGDNGERNCAFEQHDGTVRISGFPDDAADRVCPVVRLDCAEVPTMELNGGLRIPNAAHPPYDPCPSDIGH